MSPWTWELTPSEHEWDGIMGTLLWWWEEQCVGSEIRYRWIIPWFYVREHCSTTDVPNMTTENMSSKGGEGSNCQMNCPQSNKIK